MSVDTGIQWTDATWNPVRGCSRVSEGCRHCYAEAVAARFSDEGMAYAGLARRTTAGPRWTGDVRVVEDHMSDPLRWRKPRRVFVNSMSDLFHEQVSDETISRVFAVMALAPQHTFQVLTKRADRMQAYVEEMSADPDAYCFAWAREMEATPPLTSERWPLPNVWLGVSVEDQQRADERIPRLLDTTATVRFLSAEPLLEGIDIGKHRPGARGLHWVIVGGESGPGARPCEVWWIRNILGQCRDADVACFVKQLGSDPRDKHWDMGGMITLHDRKGGDPSEWPDDIRVREFPA